MTCKAIERLILECDDRTLDRDERRMVEDHLRVCPDCRRFQTDRDEIREALTGLWPAEAPESLGLRTRRACREAMGLAAGGGFPAAREPRLPVPIVAALGLLTLLTIIWLSITLPDIQPGRSLPLAAWGAIWLISQNAVMLFAAPVILRAVHPSEREHSGLD